MDRFKRNHHHRAKDTKDNDNEYYYDSSESTKNEEGSNPEIDKLLKTKVILKDGTETFIFSRGPKQAEFKIWPVNCHLCLKTFLRTINEPDLVLNHVRGPTHKTNIREIFKYQVKEFQEPMQQYYPRNMCSFLNPILIYPGEIITDVTTSYADRLVRLPPLCVSSIYYEPRKRLIKNDLVIEYNQKSPLLGLNAIVKTERYPNFFVYYCNICKDEEFFDDTCYQHIVGLKHSSKYIEKYFTKLKKNLTHRLQDLNSQMRNNFILEIVRFIYGKLEQWKGKREFLFVDYKDWKEDPEKHLRHIRTSLFYNEDIVKFSKIEINDLIMKLRNGDLLLPQALHTLKNQSTTEDINWGKAKIEEEKIKGRQARNIEGEKKLRDPRSLNSHDYRNEGQGKHERMEKQEIHERKEKHEKHDRDGKWKYYRKACESKMHNVDRDYHNYIQKPESHPHYKREWENFFQKRATKLKEQNIDPLSYDFSSDWKEYWLKSLKREYAEEVDRIKISLRRTLKISEKERTPNYSIKGHLFQSLDLDNTEKGCIYSLRPAQENSYGRNKKMSSHTVEVLDMSRGYSDKKEEMDFATWDNRKTPSPRRGYSKHHSINLSRIKSRSRSRSRTERIGQLRNSHSAEINIPRSNSCKQRINSKERSGVLSHDANGDKKPAAIDSINVLSILRLLTAIEDQMGSFTEVVNKHLTEAIIFEKETKSNSNELLDRNEIFVFFVTIQERLKGLLQAELVPIDRVKVINKIINDVDQILKHHEGLEKSYKNEIEKMGINVRKTSPREHFTNKRMDTPGRRDRNDLLFDIHPRSKSPPQKTTYYQQDESFPLTNQMYPKLTKIKRSLSPSGQVHKNYNSKRPLFTSTSGALKNYVNPFGSPSRNPSPPKKYQNETKNHPDRRNPSPPRKRIRSPLNDDFPKSFDNLSPKTGFDHTLNRSFSSYRSSKTSDRYLPKVEKPAQQFIKTFTSTNSEAYSNKRMTPSPPPAPHFPSNIRRDKTPPPPPFFSDNEVDSRRIDKPYSRGRVHNRSRAHLFKY